MTVTALAARRSRSQIRFGSSPSAQHLRSLVDVGRVLAFQARYSNEGGAAAYKSAALSLLTAVGAAARDGVDISAVVPEDVDALAALLRTGSVSVATTGANGVRFTNRYLVLDRSESGVVVWLSVGTGRKLDEDLNQPAVDWLCDQLRVYEPALLYTADTTRLGRGAGDKFTAALRRVLRDTGALYLGSATQPIRGYDEDLGKQIRLQMLVGEFEGEGIQGRTGRGARTLASGVTVEDASRWRWPSSAPVPPGVDLARLATAGWGSLGTQWAFLDSPATRPSPGAIIAGGSSVRDAQGLLVDQVANVRWFLSHYGRPGWTPQACAAELARRRFSTTGLRRGRLDPDAVVTLAGRNGSKICRTILDHLDFYEHGRIVLRTPDGGDPVELTGIWPPDGPWAQPEDFLRVRDAVTRRQSTPRPATRAAAGLPVTYNGHRATLVANHHRTGVSYRIEDPDARRHGPRNRIRDLVTHDDVVELVARLLCSAGEGVERAVDPARAASRGQLVADLERAAATAAALRQAQTSRLRELDPATRSPQLTGAALEAVTAAYNNDVPVLALAEADVDRAQRTLDVHERRPTSTAGLRVADLLHLASRLRDPFAPEVRTLLRTAVRDVHIVDATVAAPAGRRLTLRTTSADLYLVDDEGRSWASHVSIETQHGPWLDLVDRLCAVVDGMREGQHPAPALGHLWPSCRSLLVRMLIGHPSAFPFPDRSMDPRLLRLHMAVCFPPAASPLMASFDLVPGGLPLVAGPPLDDRALRSLARTCKEPLPLLRRIRDVFGEPAPYREYLLRDSPLVAGLYARVAPDSGAVPADGSLAKSAMRRAPADWRLHRGSLRLVGCRWCGTYARVLDRRREVDTSVCQDCGRDRSGVTWA